MKKYLPFILLLLLHSALQAQKETNIWYFGTFAGIDFNSGSPVSINNGVLNTGEGCASICDSSGNLLFYTSGDKVYNHNHQLMTNGINLNGGYSSSQSSLIVPLPGSDSIYYLFTTAEQAGSFGLQYSIIDISLQGGLGEVTDKNLPLVTPVAEKLTAVQKTGTNDIWIITHEYYTANFYAYLLTSTGLNSTPVITNVGTVHSGFGTDNAIGYMKISPDGTWLTVAISRNNDFELFDFDAATAIPSHPLTLPVSNVTYGVEYSKNSKILYASEFTNRIYQYNLAAGTDSAILASKLLIGQPVGVEIGAMQRASDGKIYVVKNLSSSLGVIENPDTLGMGCDFIDNAFSIAPNTGQEGLPNFMVPLFNVLPSAPASALAATDTGVCEKFCVGFTDQSANDPTTWHWIFEGGAPATSYDQNPATICYDGPGTYDVTLITGNNYGTDTLLLPDFITVYDTPPSPTITQNGNTFTSSLAYSYQWQFNIIDIPGATNQVFTASESGYYTVVISDSNGCKNSFTTYIVISGVTDVVSDASISISPNPSSGNFTISLTAGIGQAGTISIQVINAIGQIIFSSKTAGSTGTSEFKREINLCGGGTHCVSTGVYIIEIKTTECSLRKKIVIEE